MTTLQEAAQMALDALMVTDTMPYEDWMRASGHPAIKAIRTALAQQGEQRCTYCDGTGDVHGIDGEWRGTCPCAAAPAPQAHPDWLLKTTQDLANGIRRRCFPEVPQFQVLDDLAGVISQIDNMTCGMERKSAQPVAQPLTIDDFEEWHKANFTQSLDRHGYTYSDASVRNRWIGWQGAHGIREVK